MRLSVVGIVGCECRRKGVRFGSYQRSNRVRGRAQGFWPLRSLLLWGSLLDGAAVLDHEFHCAGLCDVENFGHDENGLDEGLELGRHLPL